METFHFLEITLVKQVNHFYVLPDLRFKFLKSIHFQFLRLFCQNLCLQYKSKLHEVLTDYCQFFVTRQVVTGFWQFVLHVECFRCSHHFTRLQLVDFLDQHFANCDQSSVRSFLEHYQGCSTVQTISHRQKDPQACLLFILDSFSFVKRYDQGSNFSLDVAQVCSYQSLGDDHLPQCASLSPTMHFKERQDIQLILYPIEFQIMNGELVSRRCSL